jgi:hypothetical protein
MLLVAQSDGLANDTTADGADFLRDFRENVDSVCGFDARLCRGSNMDGFDQRFLRLLVGERFHFGEGFRTSASGASTVRPAFENLPRRKPRSGNVRSMGI